MGEEKQESKGFPLLQELSLSYDIQTAEELQRVKTAIQAIELYIEPSKDLELVVNSEPDVPRAVFKQKPVICIRPRKGRIYTILTPHPLLGDSAYTRILFATEQVIRVAYAFKSAELQIWYRPKSDNEERIPIYLPTTRQPITTTDRESRISSPPKKPLRKV